MLRLKYNIRDPEELTIRAVIAIMGCMVNGHGEMADADYGYIGGANGKVHIYKGKEAVLRNVPQEDAVSRLVEIIEDDQRPSD